MKTKFILALGLFVVASIIFSLVFGSVLYGLLAGAFSAFLFLIVTS